MPVTFGSVGDIISVSLLVKDLLLALNDSRGSSVEYQAVIRELYILDTALLQVEQLSRSRVATPELEALYQTAKLTAAKCHECVTQFKAGIEKYSDSLRAGGGTGNMMKDTARKLQWRVTQKSARIASFRAEVTGYSDSINMLLATGMVKLLGTKNEDLKDQFLRGHQRTQASLDSHTQTLQDIEVRLDENKQLIKAGSSLTSRLTDRLDWIQKLGSELKRFMFSVVASNLAIYREIVSLRSAFMKHVDRPLCEDPFILDDAIGRIAPVHMRFVNSWSAFQAVMELRFQGKQGSRKVSQKEYVLQEISTGREIDLSLDFEDAFLPGQKISMSFVFKRGIKEQPSQNSVHCPRCNTLSEEPADVDILCSACGMWFRRITEIREVDLPRSTTRDAHAKFGQPSFGTVKFGPNPAKRKLEDVDGEDGDYSRFKRIRLVAVAKRFKAPEPFSRAHTQGAFNTPVEIADPIPRFFGSKVEERVEGTEARESGHGFYFHGLAEECTFKMARSNHSALDDSWYERLMFPSKTSPLDSSAVRKIRPNRPDSPPPDESMVHDAALNRSNGPCPEPELKYLDAFMLPDFCLSVDEALQQLLDSGVADDTIFNGYVLFKASAAGHEEFVKRLLDQGVDVNELSVHSGCIALHTASWNGQENVVKLLIERGANIDAQNHGGHTALHEASRSGHEAVVELLLHSGAKIDCINIFGVTALRTAAYNDHESIVKILIDRGADVDAQYDFGNAALHDASSRGHIDVVKLLLERGASIDLVNKDGSTALHLAAESNNELLTKLLLEKGAQVNIQGGRDHTALHTASRFGFESIVKLLLEARAEVNILDNEGYSPLLFALRGHEEVVRLLLNRGADPIVQSSRLNEALSIAAVAGKKKIMEVLLDGSLPTPKKSSCEQVPNVAICRNLTKAGSDT